MSVFLISFGKAFRCSQVLFVRKTSSRPSIGIPNLHEAFTAPASGLSTDFAPTRGPSPVVLPSRFACTSPVGLSLRCPSLSALPASSAPPAPSDFSAPPASLRHRLPCPFRPHSLRRLPCPVRPTSLRRFSAPPLCSACPSPAPGPPGQLMLRRSGSFSGEAASMSICSLTI